MKFQIKKEKVIAMKNLVYLTLVFFGVLNAQNELYIPETLSGNEFNLSLQNGTTQLFDGDATETMGANGGNLAPTLIFEQGEYVNINVTNNIGEETTIHWHGMHISPENDGGPHSVIIPGETWNPNFIVMDKACTMWYHPHLHQKTNEHVTNYHSRRRRNCTRITKNLRCGRFPFKLANQTIRHIESDRYW